MGTQGVKLKYNHQEIFELIQKHRGRIVHIAKELKTAHLNLKKYIESQPDLKELMDTARQLGHRELVEDAELAIADTLSKDMDPALRLKSAMYTLNSRGAADGWSNTMAQNQILNLSDKELKKTIKEALKDE